MRFFIPRHSLEDVDCVQNLQVLSAILPGKFIFVSIILHLYLKRAEHLFFAEFGNLVVW